MTRVAGRQSARPSCLFSASERAFIRRELGLRLGGGPELPDGIALRTWRSGPRKGRPKLPAFMASMLARGLVEVRAGTRGPRAHFTEAGLRALRHFVLSGRTVDRAQLAHLRRELGVATASREGPVPAGDAVGPTPSRQDAWTLSRPQKRA